METAVYAGVLLEIVRLIKQRGVSYAQAAEDRVKAGRVGMPWMRRLGVSATNPGPSGVWSSQSASIDRGQRTILRFLARRLAALITSITLFAVGIDSAQADALKRRYDDRTVHSDYVPGEPNGSYRVGPHTAFT